MQSHFSNLDYLYWIVEGKDRLIDRLPSLDNMQKTQMKRFFAKRPNLESKFDWNRPDTITWDAFRKIADEYEDPIDPNTVPELSDPKYEGDGITSYLVQDDEQGQLAMRKIIDTHWGKDSNPWCLLAYSNKPVQPKFFLDGNPIDQETQSPEKIATIYLNGHGLNVETAILELEKSIDKFSGIPKLRNMVQRGMEAQKLLQSGRITWTFPPVERELNPLAFDFWRRYSALPKRVAFKDGKLLAFMATEGASRDRSQYIYDEAEIVDEMGDDEHITGEFLKETGREARSQYGYLTAHFKFWVREKYGDEIKRRLKTRSVREQWWDRNDRPHPHVYECA